MRWMIFAATVHASSACAEEVFSFAPEDFAGADVVIVGEVHDNPDHHVAQAEVIAMLRPRAVVFEMLTEAQAALVTDDVLTSPALGDLLDWEASGWPDFAMYAPVFAASEGATIVGAAADPDRAQAARADMLTAFGDEATAFGLTTALPEAEQAIREQGMQDGHCGALPPEMLPWFVDLQRFRDAVFAQAALQAFEDHGGPVIVVTGNGHARNDWGIPVYLQTAAPKLTVISVGQITGPATDAPFDLWRITPDVDRPDPCVAFQ